MDIYYWVDRCQKESMKIILNSINLDGQMAGVDKAFKIEKLVDVPMVLISCSTWVDFADAFNRWIWMVGASTFFSTDQNIVELKQKLKLSGTLVRAD